ncbi:MobV family relaxase [Parabacteroides sp. AM08-6]|uniref:MobV family relaxase n=1 Tax=Parabacteroides sp. AM08-6 TaxID=2292053 RepID=UPI000EFFCBF4|nr:MobV family relaxase [Parabacteroides sp. AM08-6]RHJ82687.1 mobilization protein [Parabacteroides sp. AM08-6]
MGYAVLHLEKAVGSDSGMSAHIERTIAPKNADANRTHLNWEMITFPDGVTNRTEAIQHRLETAGLQRKIGKNQVRAVRILLTGSPDDMKRIEQADKLDDWCRDNLDWLKKTYGAENIVSAVVHLDETTPHIHATMIPIVTGERRKAKAEQTTGKKKYRKKSTDTARLCADDVMSRVRLKEYQNTYAEQMAKYGLQRGIDGSQAKHVTTSQYYRDLLTQSESVQENITQLLEQKEQAEQELSSVKADIKKEKLKNSAADVGATLLDGVGSLFGSSKTKQQQQQIEALTAENCNLSNDIKELSTKISAMEIEHKTATDKLSEQLNKIFNYFPHIKELLRWEGFLRSIGLPDDMVRRLFNKETVVGSGELYSKEHSKRFKVENASLKLEQDKAKPENIRFTVNGTDVFDWFKQKQREFLSSLGINIKERTQQRKL